MNDTRTDRPAAAAGSLRTLEHQRLSTLTPGPQFGTSAAQLATTAEARHADVMELSLYNSILSGIGLDGKSWFYTNPLRFYGQEHKLLSQDAFGRFQPGRVHVCCPSNLVRTVAGVHGFLYGVSDEGLWVNLYGASTFDGALPDGARVTLMQETRYPWDGAVTLTFQAAPDTPFSLLLRIPAWAEGASVKVNGAATNVGVAPGSYARLERTWRAGDVVAIDLPMEVRLIEGHPKIESTRNQVAVSRGPLIYCLESPDLPEGVHVEDVSLSPDVQLTPRSRPHFLGGVTVLEGEAEIVREPQWSGNLYRRLARTTRERRRITLIPYYTWANRDVSAMTVWLPLAARA